VNWTTRLSGLLGYSRIESHFFPSLNLYDLRIMDNDFHRSETQVSQRLRDRLFDRAYERLFHDDLRFPFLHVPNSGTWRINSYNSGRHC